MPNNSNQFRAQICVCAWREIDIPTLNALNRTLVCQNPRFGYMIGTGDALISRTRAVYATKFLKNPAMGDVLLFIDSDIVFDPRDAIQLVTLCHEGYPVIGGLYVTRYHDQPRPAVRLKPGTWINFDASNEPIEIVYASTGFMAIHRKVLESLAKNLPLCRPGHKDELYPFFQPIAYNHDQSATETGAGWEYLSEDWAFCQLARDIGYSIYLAPSVQVGHMGQRTYWVNDLSQKTIDTTYAVVTEGTSHRAEMINDLARFRQLDPRQVAETLSDRDPMQGLIEEWTKAKPVTAEEVAQFWATCEWAIDAFALHNNSARYTARLQPARNLIHQVSGSILDLGGTSLGSATIDAKEAVGAEPIYVEPEGPLRDFAVSRFTARGLKLLLLTAIDQLRGPSGQALPVDAVIAIDTLSLTHPERACELIRQTYARLAPGGRMVIGYAQQEGWPFCLTSDDEIRAMMTQAGFVGGPVMWRKTN